MNTSIKEYKIKNPIGAQHDKVIGKRYSLQSCRYLVSPLKIFTTVMIAQGEKPVNCFNKINDKIFKEKSGWHLLSKSARGKSKTDLSQTSGSGEILPSARQKKSKAKPCFRTTEKAYSKGRMR